MKYSATVEGLKRTSPNELTADVLFSDGQAQVARVTVALAGYVLPGEPRPVIAGSEDRSDPATFVQSPAMQQVAEEAAVTAAYQTLFAIVGEYNNSNI